jgi:hypothetical protein
LNLSATPKFMAPGTQSMEDKEVARPAVPYSCDVIYHERAAGIDELSATQLFH